MPFVRSAITLARERKSRSPDRGLPNSAAFFVLAGYIERRSGRWDDAQNDFSTAVKLDPRNPNAGNLLADTYILRRRYQEAEQTYARAIAAGLDTPIVRFRKAVIAFSPVGDVAILRTALAQTPPDLDVGGGETALRVFVDLVDHNYDAAARTLAASPRGLVNSSGRSHPRRLPNKFAYHKGSCAASGWVRGANRTPTPIRRTLLPVRAKASVRS
jgi:tetratricopeptide (TPR) repeat protein